MKSNGIEPYVTIYHWELPQPLQELGGWPNPLIVDWFAEYAEICFELFGDTVKNWMTFNEPKQFCHRGYGSAEQAPVIKIAQGEFLCAHHVLLAHAKVWKIYQEKFKRTQKGKLPPM